MINIARIKASQYGVTPLNTVSTRRIGLGWGRRCRGRHFGLAACQDKRTQ